MRRTLPILVLFAFLLGTGCQQLFTTSLASGLAREPVAPTSLDAAQAAVYADQLASDPDPAIAQAAMPALADLVAADPSPAVVSDAAAVAAIATGLDTALTEALVSLDIAAVVDSGTLDSADALVVAAALAGVSTSADSTAVFTALADADPLALAEQGVDATVFVVAAAALAIADIESQGGITLAGVLEGTDTYTPSGGAGGALDLTLQALADGALAVSPDSEYASLLQGLLGI